MGRWRHQPLQANIMMRRVCIRPRQCRIRASNQSTQATGHDQAVRAHDVGKLSLFVWWTMDLRVATAQQVVAVRARAVHYTPSSSVIRRFTRNQSNPGTEQTQERQGDKQLVSTDSIGWYDAM